LTESQLNYRENENAARSLASSAAFFVPYISPGMRLLDCGCGPGSITVDFAEFLAPGEVVGVDLYDPLERARKTAAQRGVKNVRFESGDIYDLQFPDASFDAVWTSSVIQWLDKPEKAVREVFRVLKPGGVYASRDRDRRGDLFGNSNRLVRRALTLHYWQNEAWSGGDLSFGGKMPALMYKVGFEKVITSGSYENHSGLEGARFTADNYDRIFRTDVRPESYKLIMDRGWATGEQMAEMLAAWHVWGEDPRSFYCICRVENVAWKPK
jgi:SAM-dependent methyltransferase